MNSKRGKQLQIIVIEREKKMSDNELKTYYNAFSSAWMLFRKYAAIDGEKDQAYWSRLVEDASRVNENSPTRLTKNLVNVVLKELEIMANESNA